MAKGATGIHPTILGASHFSALQPLLSAQYTPTQLRSLLAISLLFWQRPTFTDTQIADNPHLFREFSSNSREIVSPLIRESLSAGEARLLVRTAFYRTPEEEVSKCATLKDVFEGWKSQAMPEAWVVSPELPNRARFVDNWNDVTPTRYTLGYDYLAVKGIFQERAREALGWRGLDASLGPEKFERLSAVLKSNWFSHSHIYSVLNRGGTDHSDLTRRFGLMDESAYAAFFRAGISALDVPHDRSVTSTVEEDHAVAHLNHIMSSAFSTVDVGSLSLLALLSFDEILQIRQRGRFLLDLIQSLEGRSYLDDSKLVELALALAAYWKLVCGEIDRLHPGATRGKTRFGLAVSKQSILPIDEISNGVSVVLSGIASHFTGASPDGQTNIVRKLIEAISFKFILSGEGDDMKALRAVLSRNVVLSSSDEV